MDQENDQSSPIEPKEIAKTPLGERNDRFIGHRDQASSKPRAAPVGPQGQPLASDASAHRRGFIIIIAAVIGIGGWILYNTARSATKSPETFGLGADRFEVSRDSKKFSASVIKDGPRLYQALSGNTDLWVNFVDGKWVAFRAWPADKGRACPIQWSLATKKFTDCTNQEWPPNGAGLVSYQTVEEKGVLAIDLRTTIPPIP